MNLSDPETALWEEAKKGNAEEDYQAYLNQFPNGKYIALAKTKLARLNEEVQAASHQQDQLAWAIARQGNSQDSYATYLSNYPKGQFAVLAQGRKEKIKREAASIAAKQQAIMPKGYVTQDGLTWMPISSSRKTWVDANNYCDNTEINGLTGWRLPTKDEWIALNDSDAKSTLKWTLGNAWLSTLYGTGNHYYFTLPNGFTGGLEDQLHAFVSCVHLVRRN